MSKRFVLIGCVRIGGPGDRTWSITDVAARPPTPVEPTPRCPPLAGTISAPHGRPATVEPAPSMPAVRRHHPPAPRPNPDARTRRPRCPPSAGAAPPDRAADPPRSNPPPSTRHSPGTTTNDTPHAHPGRPDEVPGEPGTPSDRYGVVVESVKVSV